MSITVNDGGVLRRLGAVTVNDGGVLRKLGVVNANDGGVLRAIFKSAIKAVWTSFGSAYSTILSTQNGSSFTTVTYSINSTITNPPNTVKCVFDIKSGQTLHVEGDISKSGGTTSSSTCYLYDNMGKTLAQWNGLAKDIFTADQNLKDCYMVFYARKSSSAYTATHTITLTLK